MIPRPSGIVACFKFARSNADLYSSTLDNSIFVVFGSHPRPLHPQGAGLSFGTLIENTARTLSGIPWLLWLVMLSTGADAPAFVGYEDSAEVLQRYHATTREAQRRETTSSKTRCIASRAPSLCSMLSSMVGWRVRISQGVTEGPHRE